MAEPTRSLTGIPRRGGPHEAECHCWKNGVLGAMAHPGVLPALGDMGPAPASTLPRAVRMPVPAPEGLGIQWNVPWRLSHSGALRIPALPSKPSFTSRCPPVRSAGRVDRDRRRARLADWEER